MQQVLTVVTMFVAQEIIYFLAWKTESNAVSTFRVFYQLYILTRFLDCGNTLQNGGAPASSGCNVACAGQPAKICGGVNRLSLYKWFE